MSEFILLAWNTAMNVLFLFILTLAANTYVGPDNFLKHLSQPLLFSWFSQDAIPRSLTHRPYVPARPAPGQYVVGRGSLLAFTTMSLLSYLTYLNTTLFSSLVS